MIQTLDKDLRRLLEKTVKAARKVAESAARAALEQLGVGQEKPEPYLSDAERALRNRLRVHGKQLGDLRQSESSNPTYGAQEVRRLEQEVAYQHWHRMLFARFLAENNLLMYDTVAVSLGECDELAAEAGMRDGWELASKLAARMLPQIFRPDSPLFALTLAPEHQRELERLLKALPAAVFQASDSLGWVYQFWQAEKSDRINNSEVKIGADELPAVTQRFTEPYMVSFLLDNTLGAWWAARRLTPSDLQLAQHEEELRRKAAIPGVPLDYLRFVKVEMVSSKVEAAGSRFEESGKVEAASTFAWTPAAGTFASWPARLAELKTLDPCCGSGHFLVAAFHMLVPIRMELEQLSAREAVDAVLRENLHGLELDQRCVELAAFALALAAWKYPGAGGYRVLPDLNVACSGLSVSVAREEWKQLGLGRKNLALALEWMHDTFQDAPILGSLIDPARSQAARLLPWDEFSIALEQALRQEPEEAQQEVGVVARGLARAATLLAGRYHWVITNVPYLGLGKQSERLGKFAQEHYPNAKNDLATVFLERCLDLCVEGGTSSVVLPQNWLFLTTYKEFREMLLKRHTWHTLARLGSGAFETISGEVVKAILIVLSRGNFSRGSEGLFGVTDNDHLIRGLDVSGPRTAAEKASQLLTAEIKSIEQAKQLENPDARIALEKSLGLDLLQEIAQTGTGIQTFDSARFLSQIWECASNSSAYIICQTTVDEPKEYGGLSQCLKWESGAGDLSKLMHDKEVFENYKSGIWKAWSRFVGNQGVCVSLMRQLPVSLYYGQSFDNNTGLVIPQKPDDLPAVWAYCSSSAFNASVREIDQSLKVTNATLVKVPFDLDRWTKVAKEKYPHGLPKPYTDDPTQWIFHGHPCGSVIWDEQQKWTAHGRLRTDASVLQVAVARLLGYRWPAELDPEMELADEQREWVTRCQGLTGDADADGIVCLPAVRGEAPAADRLLNLLAAAYDEGWSNDTLSELLNRVDHAGRSLDSWLREKFFLQHCKLFHHRPFIWHIWDGLQDGFAALVNYHKLDYKTLETLIYTYLGDWISRQKSDIGNGVDGATDRLAAAEGLKKRLELILAGESPYDIFVRWKPIERQPIGWNPDLNDGVRLNIRPFLTVPDVGRKGAGVLREKPNIKWDKDRGRDVQSAPWYHVFAGDRINDHHLTLAEKRAAREASE